MNDSLYAFWNSSIKVFKTTAVTVNIRLSTVVPVQWLVKHTME
jgi:hypothetical protein